MRGLLVLALLLGCNGAGPPPTSGASATSAGNAPTTSATAVPLPTGGPTAASSTATSASGSSGPSAAPQGAVTITVDGVEIAFGAGMVITIAVENGDAAGNDYEFIASVRRYDDWGLTYDWSMGAPKKWRGSRSSARADLDAANVIDNWHSAKESGTKPGRASLLWSRSMFERLERGETVQATAVPATNASTFHLTGTDSITVPINDVPRALPSLVIEDEKKSRVDLLKLAGFPLPLTSQGKWNARVVSIRTGEGRLRDTLARTGSFTTSDLHFDTGSDVILPEGEPLLDEIAAALKAQGGRRVTIEGHTDSVGDDKSNLDLSRRRAETVKRGLVERGLDDKGLSTAGFGESKPVGDNTTLAGRAQNRRVVFVLQ